MGLNDKIKNAAEDLAGKAKEAFGAATDNEQLQAEGKAEQVSAAVKDKIADIKDVFTK